MNWAQQDVLDHPAMDLSLEQLFKELNKALKHNEKVSSPNYKYKGLIGIKPVSIDAIYKFIKLKEDKQLSLDLF